MLRLRVRASPSSVLFYDTMQLRRQRLLAHSVANPVRHEPCAPVRDLEHSVKLVGAHAFLAGTEQVISQQPLAQGDMGILEDRSHGYGELLTASAALPHALANVGVLLGRLWL